jgi:hypothetical protein
MPTESIPGLFGFEPVEGREVVARFRVAVSPRKVLKCALQEQAGEAVRPARNDRMRGAEDEELERLAFGGLA